MRRATTALAVSCLLAGCGSTAAEPVPPTAPTAASSSGTPAAGPSPSDEPGVAIDVTIADGRVEPTGERVEVAVGEPVTLHVVTDAADEIHVHSDPEHEYEVAAGDDRELTFTVETPGQVAVESHELGRTIVQLVVRP